MAKRIKQAIAPEVVIVEYAAKRRATLGQQTKQQVLGADVLVAQLRRLDMCCVERLLEFATKIKVGCTGTLDLGASAELGIEVGLKLDQVHSDALEQGGGDAVLLPR